MPSHRETRIVPYSAEQLFDLVADIEKYPEFLPWCIAARINEKTGDEIEADVVIGYKMFREKFSSRVHTMRATSISVEYLQGPMRHLHNKWEFKDVSRGQCQIDFFVDFTMKSKFLEGIVDQFFHKALVKMINAFEARALEVYGGDRH